jgi:polyferredoxin
MDGQLSAALPSREESKMLARDRRRWAGVLAILSGIVGVLYFPLWFAGRAAVRTPQPAANRP